MKKQVLAIASILTLAVTSTAFAGDIYKWTDTDGNVHYGDRPTGEQPERVAIASRPTDSSKVQAQVQARVQARTQVAEERAAAAAAGPSPEELQAEAKERAQKCTTYRDRLQSFITSRRLYREDEDGERTYLDEGEVLAARSRVENQVDEYCSP